MQTVTSLPHTQRDILWTARGLDPVLEEDGETTSQEGVDDAHDMIDDVDAIDFQDNLSDVVDDPVVMDETDDAKDEPMMLMLAALMISTTMMTALAPFISKHAATAKSGKRNKT